MQITDSMHSRATSTSLLELHKTYVQLYIHEDLLIWSKARNFFWINSTMMAAYATVGQIAVNRAVNLIPIVAIFYCCAFYWTMRNSKKHIDTYRNYWEHTEEALRKTLPPEVELIIEDSGNGEMSGKPKFGGALVRSRLTTSQLLLIVVFITMALWAVVLMF